MAEPILVAGAGIGGLSAALALARCGLPVHIVERTPEIREVGAGLQLGPNAFRAFARLGLTAAMDAISFRPDAIRLIDSLEGRELSHQTLGAPFEARFGHPYRVAYRADVQAVLLEAARALPDAVAFTLGDGLKSFAAGPDGVAVELDSGRRLSGVGLIGADGIWSAVRAQRFGPSPPQPSGHIAYRAVLPVEAVPREALTDDVQVWIGPGHHLVCYKLRGGSLFNLIAIVHSDRVVNGWDTVGERDELVRGFADACPAVHRLVELVGEGRMWALSDRDPLPGWSDGLVTLLGDAAHPMLPYLAQGACMAIEDAVRLADEVSRRQGDLASAFAAYESARFARTASVQRAARETGVINHAAGEARVQRNAFLAGRRADDYEAVAWLFGGDGPRAEAAAGAEIGIFGRHTTGDAIKLSDRKD